MNALLLLSDRPAKVFPLDKGDKVAKDLSAGCPEWSFLLKCVSATGGPLETAKVIIEVFDEENEFIGTW